MKINALCPISINKIDENIARLNALFTVLLLVLYLLTENVFPILFLLFDFTLRGVELGKFSPLALLAKFILKSLHVKPKTTNAGPKIFAARIGIFFSFLILLFSLLELPNPAIVFTAIFGLCAFLESAFNFCVACQIYPYVYKWLYKSTIEHSK
jgi:hypothetical protein